MSIIASDHSLPGQHGAGDERPPPPGMAAARSDYTYLFPGLSNSPEAGLFPGTGEAETLQRLLRFEETYRTYAFDVRRMSLPPAFTYFGQFVNHDLSAPVGGVKNEDASIAAASVINSQDLPGLDLSTRAPDTGAILRDLRNEQESPLTLCSLYAEGPYTADPEVRSLYDGDGVFFRLATSSGVSRAALAATTLDPANVHRDVGAPDIPRHPTERKALIADRRNDENLLISQLHLALMLVHNKAARALGPSARSASECFTAARRLVTRHYHWCILNDYLPKLLWEGVLGKVLAGDPRLTRPEVPMEFTTAAFRFGHSMVSQKYDFNPNFGAEKLISPAATLPDLFAFTSRGGMGSFGNETVQLPDHWVADWDRLTRAGEAAGADRIDMRFAPGMLNHLSHTDNMRHSSIFFRNVLRGFHRRIAFGQDYARAYRVERLTADQILDAMPLDPSQAVLGMEDVRAAAMQAGFGDHTPAWLYFLCEADALAGGQKLGPTASYIIADTVVGLIRQQPDSILNLPGGWRPADSPLRRKTGEPLDSIRNLLLFSAEREAPV